MSLLRDLGEVGNDTNQQEAHAAFCAVNNEAHPLLTRGLASSSFCERATASQLKAQALNSP